METIIKRLEDILEEVAPANRTQAVARTKIEEAIMWLQRGATQQ